jgi:hypothetical protein
MTATSSLRKSLVDLLTGNGAYTPPPVLYLSLHSADPGQSGSHAFEVTGGGYARQSLAGKMGVADPVTGISVNTVTINFGPASSPWGTIAFLGIESSLTGGNMLMPGVPATPKTITTGQPFQIVPGNLSIRLT